MKRLFLMIACCILTGVLASASIVPCSTISTVDLNSAALNGAGNGCSIGGLTFSNFGWANAGVNSPANVLLVNVVQNGGVVDLNFNPLMPANADIHIDFLVTGYVQGMDLNNTTGPSSVNEANYGSCSGGNLNGVPNGGCVLLVQTGAIVGAGGSFPGPTPSSEFFYSTPQNSVWVFKDLNTSNFGPNAENSGFTESFVVPEPMSFLLLGAGLLGLGLVKRKAKR
jgi:hypothetical protein